MPRDVTKLAEQLRAERFARQPFEGTSDPSPLVQLDRDCEAPRESQREKVWAYGEDYGPDLICGKPPLISFPRGGYLDGEFRDTGKHQWGDAPFAGEDSRIEPSQRRDCGPVGGQSIHPAKSWLQGLARDKPQASQRITQGLATRRTVGNFMVGQQRRSPAFADYDELKYLSVGEAMQYTQARVPTRDCNTSYEADATATEAARAAYALGHNAENLPVTAESGLGDRMSSNPDNTEARFRHLVDPFTTNIAVNSLLREKYPSSTRMHTTESQLERHFWVRPFTTGYAYV